MSTNKSAANAAILERLRKILALAEGGVGGEKQNAERMLAKLLKKYNMSIDDITETNNSRTRYEFLVKKDVDKKLLIQCVYATIDNWDMMCYISKDGHTYAFDLTPTEYIEIAVKFEVHKRALTIYLKQQAELAFSAYIQANRLFPATPSSYDKPPTPATVDELNKMKTILNMSKNIEPTIVRRAITHQKERQS